MNRMQSHGAMRAVFAHGSLHVEFPEARVHDLTVRQLADLMHLCGVESAATFDALLSEARKLAEEEAR